MFILYKIKEQIAVDAQEYSKGINRSIRIMIFNKYLYKICYEGICIKIKSIQIIDNIILRKEAEILATIVVELVILKLVSNQYFQGVVKECSQSDGIIISFFNGLLQGRIKPQFLHQGSLFSQNQQKTQKIQQGQNVRSCIKGKWILPYHKNQAFTWQVGDKSRFKIQQTNWKKQGQARFADIITLKADEQGLGPVSWWI